MSIKQLYNDNLRKLPNEYGDVSVMLNSLITHVLNQNEKLYWAFVDFTEAFDFVVRDILWYKLIKVGVRGKMLDIIRSMYTNVKSQVKQNSIISDAFFSNIGVRLGEYLSPFLFSMYLNDLEDFFCVGVLRRSNSISVI